VKALQLLAREVLRRADAFEWSVQGFGLLRLYLGEEGRLHVWAPGLRYANVSVIHDHSWDLKSTIIAGHLTNRRYYEASGEATHWKRKLVTGYNTEFVEKQRLCRLVARKPEDYYAGDVYSQRAKEIHETEASPYAITLLERKEDTDGFATVYWPGGTEWGTAKPRPATAEEVRWVAGRALEVLNGEI
jgi:hypothetical protein